MQKRVRIDGVLYPYVDATVDVPGVRRTLAHVMAGRPGSDDECMNAHCIMDPANAARFPHPVLAVSVIDTRAYVLADAGIPDPDTAYVVRYCFNEAETRNIQSHDVRRYAATGGLDLLAPRGRQRAGESHRRAEGGAPDKPTKNEGVKGKTFIGSARRRNRVQGRVLGDPAD